MNNYDPRNLGPYIPADSFDLQEVASFIARMRKAGRIDAWKKVLESDIYDESERKEICDFISWEEEQELYVSRITWQNIRQYLVERRIFAFTLDDKGDKIVIDPDFWVSDFAPAALSASYIDIPMYKAKGRIFVRKDSRRLIGMEMYDQSYDAYSYPRVFKVGSVQERKTAFAMQMQKELSTATDYIELDEIIEERVKLPRGRRRSFNTEAYLIELVRILVRDRPDWNEYGMKKKVRGQIREAYEKNNIGEDLPDDDTLSRFLAEILKEPVDQEKRLIAHKPG